MKKVLLMMVATITSATNVMANDASLPVYSGESNALVWVVGLLGAGLLIYLFSGRRNSATNNQNQPGTTATATASAANGQPIIAVAVNGNSTTGNTPNVQVNIGQQGAVASANCIPPITTTQQVTITPKPITFDVQTQTSVMSVTPVTPTNT